MVLQSSLIPLKSAYHWIGKLELCLMTKGGIDLVFSTPGSVAHTLGFLVLSRGQIEVEQE